MRKSVLFIFGLFMLSSVSVSAKPWSIDYPNSHLTFTGNQGGQKFDGGFKNFTAMIDFDPAHPETGKITADIDITSITAGSSERDAYLPQIDWFNTAHFPRAQFVSSSIKVGASPNCYEVAGDLMIKGIKQSVLLPFCLTPEGDHMRAKGNLTLQRNLFSIGTGQWSGEDVVSHAVTVSVDLNAK